jgi:hypothetical protein
MWAGLHSAPDPQLSLGDVGISFCFSAFTFCDLIFTSLVWDLASFALRVGFDDPST